MATLVQRSGWERFAAGSGEVELPQLRTRTTRTFRLPDAPDGRRRFRVAGAVEPVHYKADPFSAAEAYKDIDLQVELTPGETWDAACETAGYQVRFWQKVTRRKTIYRYVAQYRRAGRWLAMAPLALAYENDAGERQLVSRVIGGIAPAIDNDADVVRWPNAFGTGLHFEYHLRPGHFRKALVIEAKANLPTPAIGAAGRRLTLAMAVEWDGMARPANGFAATTATALGDASAGTPDESLDEPGEMRFGDARGALWLLQRPIAWDSADRRHVVAVDWRLRRVGAAVCATFSVPTTALGAAAVEYPVTLDASISEEQVGASTDDSSNNANTFPGVGNNDRTSTTAYLGANASYFWMMGARFATVPIPAGATIDSASMSVCADASWSYTTRLTVCGDDHDDAATWGTDTNTATGTVGYRTQTTAHVDWNIGTTAWTAGTWYESADLAAVVQEIVDRAGWAADQAMALIVENYATSLPAAENYRRVRTYNYTGNASGPKFNCTYTAASSAVKKVSSVVRASVKKVSGVELASVKKVAGVA